MRFTTLDLALEAQRAVAPLIKRVQRHDRKLAQQLRDATNSFLLNLGEGAHSDPGTRRSRYQNAAGSTSEVVGTSISLGCAESVLVADGVHYQQGWLVALSNAANAPDIGCGSAEPGPPTRIDFVFLASFGPPSFLGSFDAGAPLDSLAVAPHPRGLQVAFRVASGGAAAPIRWLRFDAPTQEILGPADVTGPADAPEQAFAATAFGNDIAIVWGNDPADNPPDLVVSVLDENGEPKASATLDDHFHSSVSILGAYGGQSLVIAWDETNPATQASTITLARFDRSP